MKKSNCYFQLNTREENTQFESKILCLIGKLFTYWSDTEELKLFLS